ncbi:2-isopropylmalate synthase [Caldanaerobius polysaccharolyticus]|uniref:2-isopropylmalate synthase n=1 Tax=Caldanaerobius polysaccharolyticus TaxID=44256 RepID=UPI00047B11AE|nr:2-isopropylmalate synthase [Caldanaerobius polysaccharolyticus]
MGVNDVIVYDTTLRDGEQTPGVSLNAAEKLEIAKQLKNLNVDVIEAGFPIASRGDFEAVKLIAAEVRGVGVSALARASKADIDRAYEALKGAEHPRIHVFIATSDIHLKHKLKMSREEALNRAVDMVAYARSKIGEVQFSAEDATRSDWDYLAKVYESVIEAGATIINIPDTVGYTTPGEFAQLINYLKTHVRNIDKAIMSVHCHNDLGMAVANSLTAAYHGVKQIEVTVNGLGERAGNASLEEVVMALNTRKDYYKRDVRVNTQQIYRTSKLVSTLTGISVQPNKAIVGANAFAHEAGIHQHGVLSERSTYEIMTPESIGLSHNNIVLGKHSGRHAFEAKLKELGYDLDADAINRAFERFKDLADKKKTILDQDIEAIVENKAISVPEIYQLEFVQISSGTNVTPTATVGIRREGNVMQAADCGDGPVDAVFKAIEKAVGQQVELQDYFLKSVTGGKDALGEVTVKIGKNGKTFLGHGLSIDVIEASARAFISAINRMMVELSYSNDSEEGVK